MTEIVLPARIDRVKCEAEDVLSFLLTSVDGSGLPPFEAGSHVDVHLPNGIVRSYSLSNSDGGKAGYRLTVARERNGRGGSAHFHLALRPGDVVHVSPPRNNFKLCETAAHSTFIAGGIGVTPFLSMAVRLSELGRPWRLYYCVRTRARAALLDELQRLADEGTGQLIRNFDEEPGGTLLDLASVIRSLPAHDHVYCCGPSGMLDAFRRICGELAIAPERVHFEYFSGGVESATDGGYDLILARRGRTVRVKKGETALKALLAAGVDVPHSCEEGICGTCETRVIDGQPDHRDKFLSASERAENRSTMLCCSGSKSPSLTLDL